MRALRSVGLALAFLLAMSFAELFARAAETKIAYKIICHPNNPIEAVERQFLEDTFLKRTTTWPSGGMIRPVDLEASSPVRRQFSAEVLRRPVDAVRSYWQQRIFAGREVPPPELDSDEAVVRFVLRDRGAVGYVSDGAGLNGAKVLAVR